VTNTLDCLPTAALVVTKIVVNETGQTVNLPPTTFTASVGCTPTSLVFSGNVSLPVSATTTLPNNGSVSSPPSQPVMVPVAAGENCTVTETGLPAAATVAGGVCNDAADGAEAWFTTITWGPPPLTPQPITNITAGTTYAVTITNTLRRTDTLTLVKTADYDGSFLAMSPVTVSINVSCTNPTTTQIVNFTVNNNGTFSQTAPNPIAVGSICTIAELTAPILCPWATSYPLGKIITIQPGTQVLQVVNEELCVPNPTAGQVGVGIIKTPVIDGLVNYTPGVAFPITVNCTDPSGNGANMSFSAETGATFNSGV
jgi:hypothetical protein